MINSIKNFLFGVWCNWYRQTAPLTWFIHVADHCFTSGSMAYELSTIDFETITPFNDVLHPDIVAYYKANNDVTNFTNVSESISK